LRIYFIVILCIFSWLSYGYGANTVEGHCNINTADVTNLCLVPGIENDTAYNIVFFRNSNGPFTSLNDLLMVEGMDCVILEKSGAYLILEGKTTLHNNQ